VRKSDIVTICKVLRFVLPRVSNALANKVFSQLTSDALVEQKKSS
jgi:hypothetical protein